MSWGSPKGLSYPLHCSASVDGVFRGCFALGFFSPSCYAKRFKIFYFNKEEAVLQRVSIASVIGRVNPKVSLSVCGKVGEVDSPYLVMPSTVEPSSWITYLVCNGNRTEWSPIWTTAQREYDLFVTSMMTD